MTVISHELAAKCPPARLWAILSDLEAVEKYNPTVRSARIGGACRTGKGAVRECALVPKGKVVERVTNWEEGCSVGLEVIESDWPIRSMHWVTRIEPAGSGSRLAQRLEYQMKFGPAGWLLNALVMRRAIYRNVGRALQELVALAEARERSTP
jgi:Polyketide cyclase / dehydrase and lipid transport